MEEECTNVVEQMWNHTSFHASIEHKLRRSGEGLSKWSSMSHICYSKDIITLIELL